jgi:hypothetical protein
MSKKSTKITKLTLNREALRKLTAENLEDAAGACTGYICITFNFCGTRGKACSCCGASCSCY